MSSTTSKFMESSPPNLRLEARAKGREDRRKIYAEIAELARQEKEEKHNAQQRRARMERVRRSYPVTPQRKDKYSLGSSHVTEEKRRQSIGISVVEYVTPNKRHADTYATPRPETPKLFTGKDEVASPESPVEYGRHTAARAQECLEKVRANKLAEKKALAKSYSTEKKIKRKSYGLEYLQSLFEEESDLSFGRYTAARAQVSEAKSLAHQKETEAALKNTLSPSKRKETEGFMTPEAKKNKIVPSTVPFGRHTAARAKIPFRKRESILMDPEMLQSNDKPKRLNIPPKLRSASRAKEREEKQKHFEETAEKVQEEKKKKIEAKRQEVELKQLKKSLTPVYTPPPERLLNTDKVFGVHSAARALESYRYRSPKNEKPKFKAREVPIFPEDNVPKPKGFLLFQQSRHKKFEKQQKEEEENSRAFDFKSRSLPSTTFQEAQPTALNGIIERNKKRREAIEKRKLEKEKQRLKEMKFVASPVPKSCRKPHSTFKRNEEEALKKAEEVRVKKTLEYEKDENEGNQEFKARPLPASIQKDLASFPKQTKTSRARKKLAVSTASKKDTSKEAKSWFIAFTPTSQPHKQAKARKAKQKAEEAQKESDSEMDKLLSELLESESPTFQAKEIPKSASSPPDIFPRETKTSRARRERALANSPSEQSPDGCKENRPTAFKARLVPKSAFLPPVIAPKETQSSVARTKQITSGLSSPRRRMLAESKVLFDKNNVSPYRSKKTHPERLSEKHILDPEQNTIEFEESIDLNSFHDDSIDVKTLCWSVDECVGSK